jgi:hypothetical protein
MSLKCRSAVLKKIVIAEVETLKNPAEISGAPLLKNFVPNLKEILK